MYTTHFLANGRHSVANISDDDDDDEEDEDGGPLSIAPLL